MYPSNLLSSVACTCVFVTQYLWLAGAVTDDCRVLLDVEEVDGDVALQEDVVDGRLNLQAQVVAGVGLAQGEPGYSSAILMSTGSHFNLKTS